MLSKKYGVTAIYLTANVFRIRQSTYTVVFKASWLCISSGVDHMGIFGEVSQKKIEELQKRMSALGVKEADLKETFLTSSGPGGQNTNKTATSVRIEHVATSTMVRSQQARSQALNRFYARRMLCDALEKKVLGKASPQEMQIAKVRKQKERRARRRRA